MLVSSEGKGITWGMLIGPCLYGLGVYGMVGSVGVMLAYVLWELVS